MRVYEFIATYHEIGDAERFLGFADNSTEQYLWFQRNEGSEDELVPDAGNVWIERDDQRWGGPGGITGVTLERDVLSVRLTSDKAAQMGGFDEYRVALSLTDAEFAAVREQLLQVFVGYHDLLRLPPEAEPTAASDRVDE